jgi:predicted HicB family RNase H-like nuclease
MPELSVSQPLKRSPGRPPGRKPIAARYTIRLDEARHEALQRISDERGRSLHSLVLEAIDDLLRKPGGVGLA